MVSKEEEIRRAIQAKISRLLELQNLAETYQQLLNLNSVALNEIIKTKIALNELKKLKEDKIEGYISLGAGIYLEGILKKSEKLLVDVGANLAVPMDVDNAISILEKKEKNVKESIEKVQKALAEVQFNISKLNREVELLRKHLEKAK